MELKYRPLGITHNRNLATRYLEELVPAVTVCRQCIGFTLGQTDRDTDDSVQWFTTSYRFMAVFRFRTNENLHEV